MTTTVTASSVGPLTANGTTPIPFSFQSLSSGEIEVERNGFVVLPSTYTVVRNADGTGTITPNTSWGSDQVIIRSKPNYQQLTSFSRFGTFYPDMLNGPLDRLARMIIAVRDRALVATPVGEKGPPGDKGPTGDKGPPGDPGTGSGGASTVPTKSALIALLPPANGTAVMLAEPGSEGMFRFSTANQTAKVTADVDKALVVAPGSAATGASGAWLRVVEQDEYLAEWWLQGAAVSAGLPLRRMLLQVPAGATIIMPPRQVTTELPLYAHQAGLTLKGTRGLSILREAPGANIVAGGNNLFCFTNSNCTAEGMTFAPARHALEAGGEFGLGFGAYYRGKGPNGSVAALAGPLLNPRVIDCDFIDGSEGLIFIADDNGGVIRMVENPVVQGCRFSNLDYQAISLFGVTGGDVSANDISMATHRVNGTGQAIGFACVIRVLAGSSGYRIHHNWVKGLGLNTVSGSDGRSSFVYFSAMGLGPLRGKGLYGGQVDHNDVRDARVMWHFSEGPRGQLLLESNTLTNPDTNAIFNSQPALFSPDGPAPGNPWGFDELILRNNRYRGVNNGFKDTAGFIERLDLDSERVKWGAKTPDGTAACVSTVTYSYSTPLKDIHVRDCRFDFPDNATESYFTFDLFDAVQRASLVGNEAPAGVPLFGYVVATGSGSIRTEIGGSYLATGSTVSPGDNSSLEVAAGGGGGNPELIGNSDFNSATGWTIGSGASISGGNLNTGPNTFASTNRAIAPSTVGTVNLELIVVVASLGGSTPKIDFVASTITPTTVNLVVGTNTVALSATDGSVLGFIHIQNYAAGTGAVIESVSLKKVP